MHVEPWQDGNQAEVHQGQSTMQLSCIGLGHTFGQRIRTQESKSEEFHLHYKRQI